MNTEIDTNQSDEEKLSKVELIQRIFVIISISVVFAVFFYGLSIVVGYLKTL